MSTRDTQAPVGILLFLLVAVAGIAAFMAYKMMGPHSPLRFGDTGTFGEMYAILLIVGLPLAAIIGVLVYLYYS